MSSKVEAFSRWLAQERELRGLSVNDVARATKLAPNVLEGMESGKPERLPAKAYLVGYLRAYAAAVGLDPDDAVLRWQEASGEVGGAAPPRNRQFLLAAVGGLVAALLVGALVAVALMHRPAPPRSGRPSSERGSYYQPDPAPPEPGR